MGSNLLIVFGGTEEGSNINQLDTGVDDENGNRIKESSTVQSVFDKDILKRQDMDLLQFNFLTEFPSVSLRTIGSKIQTLLEGSSKDARPNYTGKEVFDGKMRDLELKIEQVKWADGRSSGLKYLAGDGSAPGMKEETYRDLSDRARDVIFSYIKDLRTGESYDNIIVMGHSRGAALATRVANALYDEYPENFLRLVLQDPVSKNVGNGGDSAVINQGRDVVKKLADAGKEVHIISKTELKNGDGKESSIYNYETYAPELIGTHYFYPDSKLATSRLGSVTAEKSEKNITDSVGNEPDMRNVYFHLADMQHGYMLQGKSGYDNKGDAGNYKAFHEGFGAYENIISTDPWTTTHSDGQAINIDELAKSSETLQKYIQGERSATEDGKIIHETKNSDLGSSLINGFSLGLAKRPEIETRYEPNNLPDGDPLNTYYRTVWVNHKNQGQDRQHALVHSLAYKTLIPTIKIDVSATEVKEGDEPEVTITATSDRTFENDQTVTLNLENISDIPTAILGEDYTFPGVEQSKVNITIAANNNKGTATIKIVDDALVEDNEKIKISIDPKDGVINKTSNLGEIKGIISDKSKNLEITIIDDDRENNAPDAKDDTVTIRQGEVNDYIIPKSTLLRNNSDVEFELDTSNTKGSVYSLTTGDLIYDPEGKFEDLDAGEKATDTFAYTLSDQSGSTDTAIVTVTIKGEDNDSNIPPDGLLADGLELDLVSLVFNDSFDILATTKNSFGGVDEEDPDLSEDNPPTPSLSPPKATSVEEQSGTLSYNSEQDPEKEFFDGFFESEIKKESSKTNPHAEPISPPKITIAEHDSGILEVSQDSPTVANPLEDQVVNPSTLYNFIIPINTFAHPNEEEILTLSVSGLPAWLSFDPVTRTFSGAPDNSNSGVTTITVTATDTVTVTDTEADSISDQFSLTVNSSLTPPPLESNQTDPTDEIPLIIFPTLQLNNNPAETVNAESGSRAVIATDGNDNVFGSNAPNVIFGLQETDFIDGNNGDDMVFGGQGNDQVLGNLGDDSIFGNRGNDTILGGQGNDWINGNQEDDFINGEEGSDTVFGGKQNDTLLGGEGNDQLFGNLGDDLLEGNTGNDLLYGGQQSDTVSGNQGNDFVSGDEGNDLLDGNTGEDTLTGGNGNDVLDGGEGNDTLNGGQGDDELIGDVGDDVLFGAGGNDTLTGGGGQDQFVLTPGSGSNLITDFTDGEDLLVLEDGLTFDQLTLETTENDTIVKFNDEILATLNGVESGLIAADDFIDSL